MKSLKYLPALWCLFVSISFADTKISALPAGTTLAGTEPVPAVQSGNTVKTTPAAIDTYVKGSNVVTAVVAGGTNLAAATDDNTIIGNGTTWQSKAIPNCMDTAGNHLNYTASSNTLSCGTSGPSASEGSYTPTCTINGGLDACTPSVSNWFRVGNTVQVAVVMTVDPSGGTSQAHISIPVASNFTTGNDASGVCVSNTTNHDVGTMVATGATDDLNMIWTSTNLGLYTFPCMITYKVLP